MARRPKLPCNYPGCPELIEAGERYCNKHKKQNRRYYEDRRGTSAERGYDYRWRKGRAWFLKRHPLCAECKKQGKIVAATVVDHIVPHRGDMDLFWDMDNWQPLCETCHNKKTAREDGGFGNVGKRG